MRVNIFTKILSTYIIIIVLSMTAVSGLQLYMIRNSLIANKEREMLVRSQDLADVIKPLLISGQDLHPVITYFNRADRILGTEVWVIDKKGKVLAASANHYHCEGNTLEATELQQLVAGRVSVRRGQSQFFAKPVIRAATPVIHYGNFIGAVILYSSVEGVYESYAKMREIHLVSIVGGIIFSVILGLFLSRYITRPLLEMSGAAERIAEGNFSERVRVTSGDELGRLGDTFNHMARSLGEYEKMRRDFVANVSHELRSPLTSIRGFVDALSEGKCKDREEEARYLAIIKKETYRLGKLVNDLLEISRFDAQVITFQMDSFPVIMVINRAVASLKT